MFEQVGIIGCGLIGSSVFRALKKNKTVKKVITFDTSKSVNEIIKNESTKKVFFSLSIGPSSRRNPLALHRRGRPRSKRPQDVQA